MSALATTTLPALATATAQPADFELEGWRSLILLTPKSDAGHDWAADYLWPLKRFGDSRIIPPRLLDTVLAGIADDGLTLASYWRH